MSLLRVKTTERRVGVVGLYHAGKTVLLTSLVNHLEHHDPDRFRLGTGSDAGTVSVRRFEVLGPDPGWEGKRFDYPAYRDALVHQGKWPAKTADVSQFVCRFERSDWRFSDCLLKLYDLPGERIADSAMVGRPFAEWSDHLLSLIRTDTPYRTACQPFLDAVAKPGVAEPDLLVAYKLALANLILGYMPLVSPSTFLLDPSGSVARPDTPDKLAATRVAGVAAGAEFCPLPADVRAARPDLATAFAERFDGYKRTVVEPFVAALKGCHALIVLIDVPTLLAAGVGMYDDNRQILRDLFHVLDPGETLVEEVGRRLADLMLPHEWRPGWITRVAFVAPKLDLVHPADRDRVLGLMKRMVGRLAEDRDGLDAGYFPCAAVVSTRVLPGDERMLVGVPYRDADGRKVPPGEEQRFAVSAVPDDWPLNWGPCGYAFPEVYPRVPARKDCPPDQINLDRVLDFVLG